MIVNTRDYRLRQVAGAFFLDLPRILPRLATAAGWVEVCNRHDRLERASDGCGVRCDDPWSSLLHACRVFPPLGQWLMQRAFVQWPVRFAEAVLPVADPELTFIVPFRGRDRLPQLLATVASILGQEGVRVECLVVEQGNEAEAQGALPDAVRYRHLPHPHGDPGWRKSWAFNVGAFEARAPVLVCHDADILVPAGYGRAIRKLIDEGYESVYSQRFLFKIGAEDSDRVIAKRKLRDCCPEEIVQNWLGGTLAIRREGFFSIGGFDERFVDWGGEDNEFFNRCMTLGNYSYGFIPFAHLFHPPQSSKFSPARALAVAFLNELLALPAKKRIDDLKIRQPFTHIEFASGEMG